MDAGAALPEGTRVEVHEAAGLEELTPEGYRKGSPQAILAALDSMPAKCTPEDVDALLQAIEEGKIRPRPGGIFDDEVTEE